MVDWLEKALRCVEAVERHCPGEVRAAFRTRARQMASELYYVGAAYVMAVLAARSSEKDIFRDEALDAAVRSICESKSSKEEKGYALYGVCLRDALKELGLPADGLSSTLRQLRKMAGLVEARLYEYADWLKKLAEAKFETERE
ncbi:MAG: type III-B CRISPR module-associated protein Cmr5 [Thermoproteus sp.]